MAAREKYARHRALLGGVEVIAGLEMKDAEKYSPLAKQLEDALETQVKWYRRDERPLVPDDYDNLAEAVGKQIKHWWPDRAYFIEVGEEDKWVQLFQPYGVPKA